MIILVCMKSHDWNLVCVITVLIFSMLVLELFRHYPFHMPNFTSKNCRWVDHTVRASRYWVDENFLEKDAGYNYRANVGKFLGVGVNTCVNMHFLNVHINKFPENIEEVERFYKDTVLRRCRDDTRGDGMSLWWPTTVGWKKGSARKKTNK